MSEKSIAEQLARNCRRLHEIENERHLHITMAIQSQPATLWDTITLKKQRAIRNENLRHAQRQMQIHDDIQQQGLAGISMMNERSSLNLLGRMYDSAVRIPRLIDTMQEEAEKKF